VQPFCPLEIFYLKCATILSITPKIPLKQRNKVKEVTLDMAANMGLIVKKSFPNATLVIDRFHVQNIARN